MLEICYTVLNSLVADWQATQQLFLHYGPQAELNPVARLLGPDAYFMPIVAAAAGSCQGWPEWAAAALWLVETWAVNTHLGLGYMVTHPLLVLTWAW